MAHESALQLQLWCAIAFSFAQLLNAPIQINRVAVPKLREFVKATCSVNLVGFKGLQACC
jgi:hypothetical protein